MTRQKNSAYVRVSDLAKRFPVISQSTWYTLLKEGRLPSTKIGHARLLLVSDVRAFLSGLNAEPTPAPPQQETT